MPTFKIIKKVTIDAYHEINMMNNTIHINDKKHVGIIRKPYLIYQSDLFFNLWNLMIVLALMYLIVILPLSFTETAIDHNEDINLINDIVNMFFILDILVNFNTTYYDSFNNLITDRFMIVKNYLQTWFLIDFFSSVPTTMLFQLFNVSADMNYNGVGKMLRLPKYYRIFKLSRMSNLIQSIEKSEFYKDLMTEYGDIFKKFILVIKAILFVTISCHFMSCALIMVIMPNTTSWWSILSADFMSRSILDKYIYAWYWAFQTVSTVGYGDNPTTSDDEIVVKIVCMFFGVLVFSNFISATMQEVGTVLPDDHHMIKIKNETDKLRVVYKLNGKSSLNLESLIVSTRTNKIYEEQEFIDKLPKWMSDTVFNRVQMYMGNYADLFKHIDLPMFKEIYAILRLEGVAFSEKVYIENQISESIYIVNSGSLAFYDKFMHQYKVLEQGFFNQKIVGSLCGMEDCILWNKYQNTLYGFETSEILVMNKHDLIKIVDKYDQIDLVVQICSQSLFFLYQGYYAVLLCLKQMQELGLQIDTNHINLVMNKYNLCLNSFTLNNLSKFGNIFYSESWYSNILSPNLIHLLNFNAKLKSSRIINKFLRDLRRYNKKQKMIKHTLSCYYYKQKKKDKKFINKYLEFNKKLDEENQLKFEEIRYAKKIKYIQYDLHSINFSIMKQYDLSRLHNIYSTSQKFMAFVSNNTHTNKYELDNYELDRVDSVTCEY